MSDLAYDCGNGGWINGNTGLTPCCHEPGYTHDPASIKDYVWNGKTPSGHTNVVSCCTTCNYLRGDILSPEETKVAVQAILKFRKEQ